MAITRRTILKYGLGGAAVLAASGAGLALRGTVLRVPKRPLEVLGAKEYSILCAMSDRLVPSHGPWPAATALEVPEKIDALLARCDPAVGEEVKLVLATFETALAGFLFDRNPRTFTGSPPEVQDEILEAWRRSRVMFRRTAFKAVKGLVHASYYASPEVYPLVGYAGPPNFGNVEASR